MIPRVSVSSWLVLALVAFVWLGWTTPGASVTAPAGPGPTDALAEITGILKEMTGDSTVETCRVENYNPLHRDDWAYTRVYYALKTPEGKRWDLFISIPFGSVDEMWTKFNGMVIMTSVSPNEKEDGESCNMRGWHYGNADGGRVLFRRNAIFVEVSGLQPYEEIKRLAAALDRLLQADELPRQVAEAVRAYEALQVEQAKAQPPPPPPPPPSKPAPTARPGKHVFLRGDPAAIPFLRKALEQPVAGPLTDEAGAEATARRQAVADLAAIGDRSTLPLLERLATSESEYLSVRVLARKAVDEIGEGDR